MTIQIDVKSDGSKVYGVKIEGGLARKPERVPGVAGRPVTSEWNFDGMKFGDCFIVPDSKARQAALNAFKARKYDAMRAVGKVVSVAVSKLRDADVLKAKFGDTAVAVFYEELTEEEKAAAATKDAA